MSAKSELPADFACNLQKMEDPYKLARQRLVARDKNLTVEAYTHVVGAIRALSDHQSSMVCPVADWLVTLRELLIDMRQYDGGA